MNMLHIMGKCQQKNTQSQCEIDAMKMIDIL